MASPTARPTMPSADFCAGVRGPYGPLSPRCVAGETRRRPPEVSSTAFTAHPPDLQPQALDGYGLRDQLSARPTWAASYPVSVRQVAALLHASFRPRLAATPLRFANTSPPSGCVGDLHPQAVEHARHTTKPLRGGQETMTTWHLVWRPDGILPSTILAFFAALLLRHTSLIFNRPLLCSLAAR